MPQELLKISNALSLAVAARRDSSPRLNGKLHYHAETELIYFRKGEGVQQVGDHFSHFKKGDLLLTGENLAHYWNHNKQPSSDNIDSVVIHFRPDFLGRDFLETAEGLVIKDLLYKAQSGLLVNGRVKRQVVRLMEELLTAAGLSRSVLLLTILEKIATQADMQMLSTLSCNPVTMPAVEPAAITGVYKHIAAHFRRRITLQEIAGVANLSPHSFCRFFKNNTGKTFGHFLLDVRIDHACMLLSKKRQNLKRISRESGFKNMTCFYKYFKLVTGKTPRKYQAMALGQ
ncbi:MAG TPA: AraC family transcriptional regulator [Chitinophagaceae bacterium]|nr:AraC family transcriptional regulator [Chitinophagaceae bacterium]